MKKLLLGALGIAASASFAQTKQANTNVNTLNVKERASWTATESNVGMRVANVNDTSLLSYTLNSYLNLENGDTEGTIWYGLSAETNFTNPGIPDDPALGITAATKMDRVVSQTYPNTAGNQLSISGVTFFAFSNNATDFGTPAAAGDSATVVVTATDGTNTVTKEALVAYNAAQWEVIEVAFDAPLNTNGMWDISVAAKEARDSVFVGFSGSKDAASTFPYDLGGFNGIFINANEASNPGAYTGYAYGATIEFDMIFLPWISYSFTNDVTFNGECFVENTQLGAANAAIVNEPLLNQNKYLFDIGSNGTFDNLTVDYGDGGATMMIDATSGTPVGRGYSTAGTYTITSTLTVSTWSLPADATDVATQSQTCTNGVGINENEMNVATYPNPAYNEFNIELNNAIEGTVNVLDLTGKVVIAQELNGANTTLNVANLNNGLYIYQIETAEGVVATGKFSKK